MSRARDLHRPHERSRPVQTALFLKRTLRSGQSSGRSLRALLVRHRSIRAPRARMGRSDPTMAEDFVISCEREAIPVLRPLDTDRKRLEFARIARNRSPTIHRMAPGQRHRPRQSSNARAIWTGIAAITRRVMSSPIPISSCPTTESAGGEPLMADDRRALIDLLYAWETENTVGNKRASLRTPGPFPIEEADLPSEDRRRTRPR